MNRRTFLSSAAIATAGAYLGCSSGPSTNSNQNAKSKRDRLLAWLAGETDPSYTPAAFFLHFPPEYKNGSAAASKHLEFFRQTDMDFVKIQFEQTYQRQDFLQKPSDWQKLSLQKIEFYEPLLVTARQLVKTAKPDALVLMTLYSPFMCAGHCATSPLLIKHLEEDPEAVKKGLEILTESQMIFVRACMDAGVDGFYMSTQGSEANRFSTPDIFEKYIKPYDLVAMKEAQSKLPFNILHVCDYVAPYANFDAVKDYPGHVVNCNPKLTEKTLSWHQIHDFFGRPCMGGLDRHGILANGPVLDLEKEVQSVIASAPKQFMLGADCTVSSDIDWNRLRDVIAVAHRTGTRRQAA